MDERFLESMDRELAGWSDPVARLRHALDNDEFALFCQPIAGLTGPERYPMAEVLVRLREEEAALQPPGEFLPVFEHHRMMPQLDRWVVSHVLKRVVAGSRIPRFTVNLSGQTLEDDEFPGFVRAELAATKAPSGALAFEIDEADTLARLEAASRCAAGLKGLGCPMMIDGFGRRSVSCAPLKSLRVDFLKIDGSIVRKILANELALNKLRAILRVCETIHLGAIAECVEEQDIRVRLKALGVGYAQGFGIQQPQPIDNFAKPR